MVAPIEEARVDGEDTGTLTEVPEEDRLGTDGGEGSDASEGGVDDDLADVYADPGTPIEESLG